MTPGTGTRIASALLDNLMNPKQRKKIGQRIEGLDNEVDWQRVGDLAHRPRAIPVPVTGGQPGMDARHRALAARGEHVAGRVQLGR